MRAMLARWGYLHVLDTYTFHHADRRLEGDALEQAQRSIAAFADAAWPGVMPVSSARLFVQSEPGADFVAARHHHFGGTQSDAVGAPALQGPRRAMTTPAPPCRLAGRRCAPDLPGMGASRGKDTLLCWLRASACRRARVGGTGYITWR